MRNIETKTTKAGKTVYYLIDANGKRHQISGAKARAILEEQASKVAYATATADDMELAIRLEEQAAECIELGNTASEYTPQATSWTDPHEYETVGDLSDRALSASNSRLAAFRASTNDTVSIPSSDKAAPKKARKKTNAVEQQQRWLANAMVDDSGRYYVVPELVYKNIEANKNWKPCFYIVTIDRKLTRIGLKFAIELAKAGKAIEVSKSDVKELNKAA